MRLLSICVALCLAEAGASAHRAAEAAELPPSLMSFLEKRCLECHDATAKKGGLDLSATDVDWQDGLVFTKWVKVHDRVRSGEMPPAEQAKSLKANDRETFVKGLAAQLAGVESKRYREQGRVALRRLNRTEYENTLRDLFSLPGLSVKELLPEDGRYDGFDKVSRSLEFSSVQLRKYMEAADSVLDQAIAHQDMPMVFRERFRRIGGLSQFGESTFPIDNFKVDLDFIRKIRPPSGPAMHLNDRVPILKAMGSLGILTHARPSFIPEVENFQPFHSGYYRIRTSVWSFDYRKGELLPTTRGQSLVLLASGRVLTHFDAPSLKPKPYEIEVWLNAADRLELNPANLWGNYDQPFNYEGPGVAVDFVEVEGPLHDTWPPASHRRLFGDLPIAKLPVRKDASPPESYPRQPIPVKRHPGARPNHTDGAEFQKWQPVWTAAAPRPHEDAERLLKDFLPRAFRRPVSPEELAVYVAIAREKIAAGDFFETAMREAYRVALCSPDFLFHQEPAGLRSPTDPMALDPYAVACRLSYFLWNSMPDAELVDVARQNKLGSKTLADQIERMLADPKSNRFVDDFLDQWLELREIDFTSPDAKLYPEFRPDLRDALLAESRAYFRLLLEHDLGVSHLVDSDFLMLNERLAEHYGVPGVHGSAIRKVQKPADSVRGGMLTQGAILKVTANGTSTSPVMRGAWVLDRILGRPPQPPPPDIPAVDPDVRGTTTIREQLDKHRHIAVCAGCHAKIDPPGFALENFDVIGGWRTQYRFVGEKVDDPTLRKGDDPPRERFLGVLPHQWKHVLNNVRLGLPVDATGVTVDGHRFKDVVEFKKILLSDEEALARNLVERLVLYATGVPVGFNDRVQVDQILNKTRATGFGVRSLIQQVIFNQQLFHRK